MTDSLRTCPLGVEIEICKVDLTLRNRFRLNELGFREHERMRVIQKAGFGGRVVAHGSNASRWTALLPSGFCRGALSRFGMRIGTAYAYAQYAKYANSCAQVDNGTST
ncbi:ferrous iron transport protein A [Bifidobacterium subtile]|uniref:ferrous iron transport protein A n=1 Tax=Bifidobacterium subtile TaxID=77635 RepID=UPI001D00B943|nr:ferrous iron transport protein A [Bifidobacterium subtile]